MSIASRSAEAGEEFYSRLRVPTASGHISTDSAGTAKKYLLQQSIITLSNGTKAIRPLIAQVVKTSPDEKEGCPWQRAMTRCSHSEKMFIKSSRPPVFSNEGSDYTSMIPLKFDGDS